MTDRISAETRLWHIPEASAMCGSERIIDHRSATHHNRNIKIEPDTWPSGCDDKAILLKNVSEPDKTLPIPGDVDKCDKKTRLEPDGKVSSYSQPDLVHGVESNIKIKLEPQETLPDAEGVDSSSCDELDSVHGVACDIKIKLEPEETLPDSKGMECSSCSEPDLVHGAETAMDVEGRTNNGISTKNSTCSISAKKKVSAERNSKRKREDNRTKLGKEKRLAPRQRKGDTKHPEYNDDDKDSIGLIPKTSKSMEYDPDEHVSARRDENHQDNTKNIDPTSRSELLKERWESHFRLLVEYRNQHGTTKVPATFPLLGPWVRSQRKNFKKGTLVKERIGLLDSIGFIWSLHDDWEDMYRKLQLYKAKHGGSTRVPKTYDSKLGNWVETQRRAYKRGELLEEKIALLESVGFEWKLQGWNEMYAQLIQYKAQHDGSTIVPRKYNGRLGAWVGTQRQSYRKDVLSEERIALLDSIGFQWQGRKNRWKEMFDQLVSYKSEHNGSTKVPTGSGGKLGTWVSKQRHLHTEGKLSEERVALLDSIGFQWRLQEQQNQNRWKAMFDLLVSYKSKHNGSTNMPRNHGKLGNWVFNQRTAYRKGKLAEERIHLLESIGFQWKPR